MGEGLLVDAPVIDRCRFPVLAHKEQHVNMLWRCPHCLRWYVSYIDYSTWADFSWRPVHWWERGLKRRIAVAEHDENARVVREWRAP